MFNPTDGPESEPVYRRNPLSPRLHLASVDKYPKPVGNTWDHFQKPQFIRLPINHCPQPFLGRLSSRRPRNLFVLMCVASGETDPEASNRSTKVNEIHRLFDMVPILLRSREILLVWQLHWEARVDLQPAIVVQHQMYKMRDFQVGVTAG